MKILGVAFAWNEIQHIAEMVEYYKKQGIDLNIVDNMSTDGTYQYMKDHGVRTRQKDTNNSFDLITLQRCLVDDIKAVRPDWIVYLGIDIIYSLQKTLRETIEEADGNGFNMISVQHINMYNTGEKYQLPLKDCYFYGRFMSRLYMIAKYHDTIKFEADSIQIPQRKIYPAEGIIINYGNCKPAAEREATYRRRKKAWDSGLDRNYGVHYVEGMERKWIWKKEEMVDIRKTDYYKYIQKI